MSQLPQLPDVLYIAWEESIDGTESWFLKPSLHAQELAELNSEREVGVYELKRSRCLVNQSKLVD